MKKLLAGLMIMALSFSVVSVLASNVSFQHDIDHPTLSKGDGGDSYTLQMVYLNDAVVPVVQSHYTCHVMKDPVVLLGCTPVVQAKARAPTYRKLQCS